MKFEDLKVEFIQTIMATQRIVCLPSGHAISFMGFEQNPDVGDGINTFQVSSFTHNLKLTESIDFFNENYPSEMIDFHNRIFILDKVPIAEINSFFKEFV